MRKASYLVCVIALVAALCGCGSSGVPQTEYDTLKTNFDTLQANYDSLSDLYDKTVASNTLTEKDLVIREMNTKIAAYSDSLDRDYESIKIMLKVMGQKSDVSSLESVIAQTYESISHLLTLAPDSSSDIDTLKEYIAAIDDSYSRWGTTADDMYDTMNTMVLK